MSKLEIFITNPIKLSAESFYPRIYNPNSSLQLFEQINIA